MSLLPYRDGARIELCLAKDPKGVAEAAAMIIADQVRLVLATERYFTMALSGGATPKELFKVLAAGHQDLDWSRIHVFWSDERSVPPTHGDSNFGMAKRCLLDKVPIPPVNIHRVHAEDPADVAAKGYDEELRRFFQLAPRQWPRFDLLTLGLGEDGHTASLFPGTDALRNSTDLVVSNRTSQFHDGRITMTLPVINHAAVVLVLVTGINKSHIVRDTLQGAPRPERLPMQAVLPRAGRLVWVVDAAAAAELLESQAIDTDERGCHGNRNDRSR